MQQLRHAQAEPDLPLFLTIRAAADLVSVSKKTVLRWIGAGQLRGYRVGRQYRVRRRDLLEHMERLSPGPRAPVLPRRAG